MKKQVDERAPAVRSERADVPPALEALIADLLAKKPEDRPGSAAEVYDALLPFVRELGMLAGVLAPPSVPSPARMYASVAGRVLADSSLEVPDEPPRAPAPREPDFDRAELDRVREEASVLVKESRYSQAAEILAAAAVPATRVLGALDPSVISLRFELANVRFDGGDYRGAAPVYRDLARDLGARNIDDELALRCRLQEATCNALIGESALAVQQLGDLLDDVLRVHGADDERALELRRQIALLDLGLGRRREARAELRALLADAERVRGPHDPLTNDVRTALHEADQPAAPDLA